MRDVSKPKSGLVTLRKAEANSAATETSDAAVTFQQPTPCTCWADSVPEEFQTPVFQGQLPPEEVFASTPVQSTGVVDSFNSQEGEDMSGAEDSMGERAFEAEAASQYVHQALVEADYGASMEYQAQYEGYAYEQEGYYYPPQEPEVQPSTHFAPPPPPQQISAEQDQAHKESMNRWYEHIVQWVDEAYETVGATLPPPPPPPNMNVAANLRPYDFRQWCTRIERWHNYVVSEFYHNVLHPESNMMSRKQAPRQSPVPQPSYAYQSPQARYQEHDEYPQQSYGQQYPSHQYQAPATYQHNPYDSTYQQGHSYGGYYIHQEEFPQLPPAADRSQYHQSTRA